QRARHGSAGGLAIVSGLAWWNAACFGIGFVFSVHLHRYSPQLEHGVGEALEADAITSVVDLAKEGEQLPADGSIAGERDLGKLAGQILGAAVAGMVEKVGLQIEVGLLVNTHVGVPLGAAGSLGS